MPRFVDACRRGVIVASLMAMAFAASPAMAQLSGVVVVENYPRYGTDIPPNQLAKMRGFSQAVVLALRSGATIEIAITGHADFDAKGAAFETQVSRDRASAAESTMRQLVNEAAVQQALPPADLQRLTFGSTLGVGTLQPTYPKPSSETERMANRRVDFVWTGVPAAPAPQEAVFQRCQRVLASAAPPGPVRRMSCACGKFLQQSPRVQDSVYNYRNEIPGSAGFPNLTPQQWQAALTQLVIHMRQSIARQANTPNDRDFKESLLNLDEAVGRSISDFQAQSRDALGAAAGNFNTIMLADIQFRMSQPTHVYSCYAGYSRLRKDD